MRNLYFAGFLSLSASLLATTALAVPATQEGADALVQVFQTYLGATPGVVTVQPAGDAYDVKLDASPLLATIPADAGKATLSPIALSLTDNGDGTWGVAQNQPMSFTMSDPGKAEMSAHIANVTGSGTFDTALMAFTTSVSDASDISVTQKMTVEGQPEQNTAYHLDSAHYETTGTAAAGGTGVDVTQTGTMSGLNEIMTMPAMTPGAAAGEISVAAPAGTMNGTVQGLRPDALLKLVAFFVANPSKEAIAAKQADLKALLTAGLPLWDHMIATQGATDISVTTPYGNGTLQSGSTEVEMSGLTKDGMFREAVNLDGLSIADGIVPAWAKDLVPASLGFDVKADKFDLAAAAEKFIASLDLSATEPVAAGQGQEMMQALLPAGKVTITLAPGATEATAYKLGYQAQFDAGPGAMPVGTATITLAGMDKILAALQSAPPEQGMQVQMMLGMAQGFAKPGANGDLEWDIESTPEGKFTINGQDMSAMMGAAQ